MRAVLPPVAANIHAKPSKNMVLFVGCAWGHVEYRGVDPVADVDMIRCLDFICLCAKINKHKT